MIFEIYLGNKTAWKILRVFSEAPGKGLSREEIRKYTKSGNLALSSSLRKLEKFNILKKKKIGKTNIYWVNSSNQFARILLNLFSIEKEKFKGMEPSKIIYLSSVIEKLLKLNPTKIFLFGSQVKGTATEQSDFDICIVLEKKTREIIKLKLPENIELHVFDLKEFEKLKKAKDPLIRDILRDGIEIV